MTPFGGWVSIDPTVQFSQSTDDYLLAVMNILDSQLKVLEKHNNDLRDQLKEARLSQYQNLESDSTSTKVQNENIPPTSKPLPKVVQTTLKETTEYPSDENHRELIQQFEKDYPAEDCKTQ